MHVAIVTAGGAGMFCGSCLHDNAWARGLKEAGVEVTLLPMYTPIRVDDENLTSTRVFYGGINLYLDVHVPGWRYLPGWMTKWFDRPGLINWATKFGVSNDAAELGQMTVATLQGPQGPQAREADELVQFLARDLKPDVIIFSNIMLASAIAPLKAAFTGPVLCSLQGDDIFLEGLREPWKRQVFDLLRPIVAAMDGFLFHSRFYAEFMGQYLGVPVEKRHELPLAIDTRGHHGQPKPRSTPFTIGYFARLAPGKGLRELVQAAVLLNEKRQDFRVVAGGYAPPQFRPYQEQVRQLAKPLGARFEYAGSPDTLEEKTAMFQQFDLLSVPSPYREPKGLYILEAWANGVPVVQPAHGHFPEMIEELGGGLCVSPGDPQALADGWERLLDNEPFRMSLADQGYRGVRERHDLPALARQTQSFLVRQIESRRQ